MQKPIRDYAIIGNLRSAALVGKDGSIDWLPCPYLDSPSVFAALLDEEKGGKWQIVPQGEYVSRQEYLNQTNILKTTFVTQEGTAELIDYMPAKIGSGKQEDLEKAEIHRKLVCTKGICVVDVEFAPRFNYAQGETVLAQSEEGIVAIHEKTQKGVYLSPGEYLIDQGKAKAMLTLAQEEEAYFAFHYHPVTAQEQERAHYERELQETAKFWNDWVHRCDLANCPIAGPWHDLVVRSSLVLKILFFEPPGSIAAAPTTSLPETFGGMRNWDYRFSWIRDSSFALQALVWMGYVKEARTYVQWLLKECCSGIAQTPQNFQTVYGLRGEKKLQEEILPHLEGYRNSKPVRIGNNAYLQKQWDIYGSMLDAVWRLYLLDPSYEISQETWGILRGFANYAAHIWQEPDEGLWEVRGGKQHFVYSKVMCWVALDRALKIAKGYGFEGEVSAWETEKERIKKEVFERGWSEEKQSFVQSFDSSNIDASLLLLPIVG
ncbi:MAG: glycoside hydrolase family 15 protein, partial [bacterium]|nr:glycoside hydrolase family 15 protein [bacterium]